MMWGFVVCFSNKIGFCLFLRQDLEYLSLVLNLIQIQGFLIYGPAVWMRLPTSQGHKVSHQDGLAHRRDVRELLIVGHTSLPSCPPVSLRLLMSQTVCFPKSEPQPSLLVRGYGIGRLVLPLSQPSSPRWHGRNPR